MSAWLVSATINKGYWLLVDTYIDDENIYVVIEVPISFIYFVHNRTFYNFHVLILVIRYWKRYKVIMKTKPFQSFLKNWISRRWIIIHSIYMALTFKSSTALLKIMTQEW